MKPARLTYVTAFKNRSISARYRGRPLVFTHIPKAAGTTLDHLMHGFAALTGKLEFRRALGTLYGQWLGAGKPEAVTGLAAISREGPAKPLFLSGHLPHGCIDSLIDDPLYVTVLRSPVERCISHYRHGLRRGGWPAGTPAADLFAAGHLVDNAMTRQIAGCMDAAADGDDAMLAHAIENLENRYVVVGTTETFNEFVKSLITYCGIPDVLFEDRQVAGADAGDAYTPTAADLAEFTRRNELDTALFAQASLRPSPWRHDFFDGAPPPPGHADQKGKRLFFSLHSMAIDGHNQAIVSSAAFDPYWPQFAAMDIPIVHA